MIFHSLSFPFSEAPEGNAWGSFAAFHLLGKQSLGGLQGACAHLICRYSPHALGSLNRLCKYYLLLVLIITHSCSRGEACTQRAPDASFLGPRTHRHMNCTELVSSGGISWQRTNSPRLRDGGLLCFPATQSSFALPRSPPPPPPQSSFQMRNGIISSLRGGRSPVCCPRFSIWLSGHARL